MQADWDKFANDIDWHFRRIKEPRFVAAVQYLLTEPPRKQVIRDGSLAWKSAPPNVSLLKAQQVLLMVRRVRNNLFHGAKVWSIESGPRHRDQQLVSAATATLWGVVNIREATRYAFQHAIFYALPD